MANCNLFSFLQIAVSMASKAATLARELKSLKSDLCFMQERCGLLEEENRRLRDGFAKGVRPEEDDLVRNPFNLNNTIWLKEFEKVPAKELVMLYHFCISNATNIVTFFTSLTLDIS